MMIKNFPKDLEVVILLALLCIPFVLIPCLSETSVKTLLSFPLMFFLPGYSLIAVLFPGKDDLDWIERLSLSIGLSIAVVPLLSPSLLVLSIFTILLSTGAYARRSMIPEKERRFGVDFGSFFKNVKNSFKVNSTKIDRILTVVLIISIILSISITVYVVVVPKEGEKFTEFYILGIGGKAENYPTQLTVGEEGEVIIGVVNHEYTNVTYQLEARLDGTVINERSISLMNNESYERPFLFKAEKKGGDQELEFLLYKDEESGAEPYLSLHLWIDVN
ncbi:MAG: DUF1616 domain-containing protein [Methanosarcinales archaeon]|uniref:DUF1616 domain-containing protein n=1 Tax=Candidatus Ethanoperedens thermophilum TaxID=2766897 RepID=A0A848D992_9EURY|nr:DUF1616 domain-containing protein [Candidatus Ethanoperedens thermophilum]